MRICTCSLLVAFMFLVAYLELMASRAAPPGRCSDDDTDVIECQFPPCSRATCPRRPDAVCLDDSCNDCQARFFVNGTEVHDCQPNPCQPGVEPGACLTEPCSVARCLKYPKDAVCYNDLCGGCQAVFYRHGFRLTEKDCAACASPLVNQCPETELVKCTLNPCDIRVADCDNIRDSTCFADYCGGCRGRWFLPNCTEVTHRCQHPPL